MRLRRKEAPDTIAQKMTNDHAGNYIVGLREVVSFRKIPEESHDEQKSWREEYQKLLKKIDWLYGYDVDMIPDVLEKIKAKMESYMKDKDSSRVRIISSIACHCILSQKDEGGVKQNTSVWTNYKLPCESQKNSECLDVLKRHCPETIEPEGFIEARRYVRMWDSEYNW